jgi:hypothetical protein
MGSPLQAPPHYTHWNLHPHWTGGKISSEQSCNLPVVTQLVVARLGLKPGKLVLVSRLECNWWVPGVNHTCIHSFISLLRATLCHALCHVTGDKCEQSSLVGKAAINNCADQCDRWEGEARGPGLVGKRVCSMNMDVVGCTGGSQQPKFLYPNARAMEQEQVEQRERQSPQSLTSL